MQYYLSVWADTNDADYIHAFNPITAEQLKRLKPLIQAIKDFVPYTSDYQYPNLPPAKREHPHNFPWGQCLREDMGEKSVYKIYDGIDPDILGEFIDEWIPHDDYGIHTISNIDVYEVENVEKLL